MIKRVFGSPFSHRSALSPPTHSLVFPLRNWAAEEAFTKAAFNISLKGSPTNQNQQLRFYASTKMENEPDNNSNNNIADATTTTAAIPKPTSSSSNRKFHIAVAQLNSTPNRDNNFKSCQEIMTKIRQQHGDKVKLVCFPEGVDCLGSAPADTIANAEDFSSPNRLKLYQGLAKDHGMWISLGGFHERADETHIFNTHVLINDKGELATKYRKIHLFDVNIPHGPNLMESKVVSPGKDLVVHETPFGKLGLTICYDMRFPEMYSSLVKMGAQIMLIPAAFTKVTGQAHWKILLQARAIETQCYVVAAAQTGKANATRESYGHSMVIDPWGRILCDMDAERVNEFEVAEIDLDYLDQVRTSMPIQTHRRPDLYKI